MSRLITTTSVLMMWIDPTLLTEIEGCVLVTKTQVCASNCRLDCSYDRQCPGACIVCKDGFYGPDCSRPCGGHCLHNRCALLKSGRAINCTEGCKPGWRGLTCNTKCDFRCTRCARRGTRCIGTCTDGFYGNQCTSRCHPTCKHCDKTTGVCVKCYFSLVPQNDEQHCVSNLTRLGYTGAPSRGDLSGPRQEAMSDIEYQTSLTILVGGVSLIVFILLIIPVIIYVWRTRCPRKTPPIWGRADCPDVLLADSAADSEEHIYDDIDDRHLMVTDWDHIIPGVEKTCNSRNKTFVNVT